ncbi:hypothetical protein XENOCAPTIV_012374, partial [Xenoophorus captivus]
QQYFDVEKRLTESQEQILSATKDLQILKEENKKLSEFTCVYYITGEELSTLKGIEATEMEKKNQELSRAVEELSKLVKETGEGGSVFAIVSINHASLMPCGSSLTEEELDSMCPSAAAIAAIVKPGMKFFDLCNLLVELEEARGTRVSKDDGSSSDISSTSEETVSAYRREIAALQKRNQNMAATAQRHEHIIHTTIQDLRKANEKLALEQVRRRILGTVLSLNSKTETRQRLNNKIERLEAELASMKTKLEEEKTRELLSGAEQQVTTLKAQLASASSSEAAATSTNVTTPATRAAGLRAPLRGTHVCR